MKRVLVVERDSLHRDLIREWLEAGGAEAVWPDAARGAATEIDAILIDVTCQQQAHEVLESWRRVHPRAAIVLVSGRFCRGDMANDAMAMRLGATRVLAKPFGREDLWAALNLKVASRPQDAPS